MNPEVLYEDNHCLVVNKPAGMLTQGDATGMPSLVDWARDDLKRRHFKPGNVFVGLVHRLDQPVSGVVILARTSKGASRLSDQFRRGTIEKRYWALVDGRPQPESGRWVDWLLKDRASNLVHLVKPEQPGAQEAILDYQTLTYKDSNTLVELMPQTGRPHQLRVQLASRGYPIVGDRKYGARSVLQAMDGGVRIALHARSVRFQHPTRPEVIEVCAPTHPDWPGPDVVA